MDGSFESGKLGDRDGAVVGDLLGLFVGCLDGDLEGVCVGRSVVSMGNVDGLDVGVTVEHSDVIVISSTSRGSPEIYMDLATVCNCASAQRAMYPDCPLFNIS